MSEAGFGTLLIALMFLLFAMGLEISISMGVVGVLGLLYLKGFTVGLGVVGSIAWSNATSFSFIALPLFVFMSGILLHSGIGEGLFSAVARWVGFLPGGLAVACIFSCAIFAAVSGSSVATAATIGMIAVPEMERRGYARPLIIGSLAAGGTLGILIPPSIPMIIYGVMTETSVGHLYMAGIIPGVVLSLMFTVYVIGYAMIWPDSAPRVAEDRGTLRDKLRSFGEVAPVAILIFVVLGSMYLGIVTPTEAAALGSVVSLVLARWYGNLNWRTLNQAFQGTARTTSMVMLIIIFAAIFSHVIALIGAPKALLSTVTALGLPKWALFTVVFSFLLVIAYALEELSVMIILLPILFPLITGLGFDPVWFGVIMVVWLEIGFITPPVGLNLFVIQGLMPGSGAREVTIGTTPYVILMILLVVILFVFPDLALWLPAHMMPGRR
ncbi:MAG: TRAP transporter large permease subunit [Candidatus Rokubacteria bacterium]|nr:TRAP transporter large permease subunit [Candidatus Rokubacteria bacterium]